jgi:hypothetical protein
MVMRPLGRRRQWENNIKIDFIEMGSNIVYWIDLAQYRDQWRAVVNTVMNLLVSSNFVKFLSSSSTGGFSRRAQLHEMCGLQQNPS